MFTGFGWVKRTHLFIHTQFSLRGFMVCSSVLIVSIGFDCISPQIHSHLFLTTQRDKRKIKPDNELILHLFNNLVVKQKTSSDEWVCLRSSENCST